MKKLFLIATLLLSVLLVKADEGMWLLKELNRESAARMKELGFTFPINNLYNENNPSLKDAVIIFGRGCTGVVVSQQGLIFTNHHCGYEYIQQLSSVQHDYLKNGFASQSFAEELPAKGLTVSFLKKTEDITKFVTSTVKANDSETVRNTKIDSMEHIYLQKFIDKPFLKAQILPFYAGNKYYAIIYNIFKDVRLVCTPPSSIGKFGGDTDNWMWPRQTGDISIFRVYANKDNEPTNYSTTNVPYKPIYSVPISLKGYNKKDYAMTVGYPGRTERYIPSWGIKTMVISNNIPRIAVREAKQNLWIKAMHESDAVRIKYASKFAISANYWKNAIGMNQAIQKLQIINKKEKLEAQFTSWISQSKARKQKYGAVLPNLKKSYNNIQQISKTLTYFNETFNNGIEIITFARIANSCSKSDSNNKDQLLRLKSLYHDYEINLDKQVMPTLLQLYANKVPAKYLPSFYNVIKKKFKNNYKKYTEWLFKNSALTSFVSAQELINNDSNKLRHDPVITIIKSLIKCENKIHREIKPYSLEIEKGDRLYMAGLMEMNSKKAFSPDANFTQRLSYGSIRGYKPKDAVVYNYYSTTQGILEKQKPGDPEFDVQPYILDSLKTKNFEQYADKDGTMHVDFLTNNDITGGNSGSPVFNGKAELIGLAFDGNWEALSGDIVFTPSVQRTICADVRYLLYAIDHIMHCHRLINELQLRK